MWWSWWVWLRLPEEHKKPCARICHCDIWIRITGRLFLLILWNESGQMQTNTSFVKIIRKHQSEANKPKAKANKHKHFNKRDIWSLSKWNTSNEKTAKCLKQSMNSKHSKGQKQWSKSIAYQTVAQNITFQAEPVKTGAKRNENMSLNPHKRPARAFCHVWLWLHMPYPNNARRIVAFASKTFYRIIDTNHKIVVYKLGRML